MLEKHFAAYGKKNNLCYIIVSNFPFIRIKGKYFYLKMADKIFNLANRDLTHLELTEPKVEAKELILSGNPMQSLDYAE